MTVAQYCHDKPFAMLNWHKSWCEKQSMPPFCFLRDSINIAGEIKRTWPNCPHRQMCFTAFINSDAVMVRGEING